MATISLPPVALAKNVGSAQQSVGQNLGRQNQNAPHLFRRFGVGLRKY